MNLDELSKLSVLREKKGEGLNLKGVIPRGIITDYTHI